MKSGKRKTWFYTFELDSGSEDFDNISNLAKVQNDKLVGFDEKLVDSDEIQLSKLILRNQRF